MGVKDAKPIVEFNADGSLKSVKGFFGDYRWLSNFQHTLIEFDNFHFTSSEAAYQSCKTTDINVRAAIGSLTPVEAKSYFKRKKIRDDWDEVKLLCMMRVVYRKFTQNKDLKRKLLDTGDAYLEETNWWGDTYWGVCKGVGENKLGKILMDLREYLRRNEK